MMTHDELLEKIEKTLGSYISKYYGSNKDVELRSDVIDSLQALRGVLELHKPCEPVSDDKFVTCETCNYEYDREYPYPCKTIQAIEKELG